MGNSGSKICILLILARDPIVIFRSYRLEQRKINSIPVQFLDGDGAKPRAYDDIHTQYFVPYSMSQSLHHFGGD